MMKSRFLKIDYSMLSSYLGRSATLLVFSAIVLLALGALFFKTDDIAHVSISIGVCAFDSARASSTLEAFADFVREKGGGDIEWTYLESWEEPSRCDFYLMASLQASPWMTRGKLDCSLIATITEGVRCSRGALIGKPGVGLQQIAGGRVIFASPVSATGFLSPYRALREAAPGSCPGPERIDFAGRYRNNERVIFGVLFGGYLAGGISLNSYRLFKRRGIVSEDELEVLLEGAPMVEIVLANDRSIESAKLRGFAKKLPKILGKMSRSQKDDLADLGIACFALPRQEELVFLEKLSSIVPSELSGRSSPDREGPPTGAIKK